MTVRASKNAFLALAAVLAASRGHAMTLGKPLNVSELVRRSSDIVVGTVTRVTEAPTGALPTVEVELRLSETIRGGARGTLAFRQLASGVPGKPENGRRYVGLVPGMPSYRRGDHVLLFLGPQGSLGLRSTVGLQQGRFSLGAGGAENGVGNQGLFRDLRVRARDEKEAAVLANTRGAIHTEAFLSLLRRAVAEKSWDGGAR
jgi:hypothetical protein